MEVIVLLEVKTWVFKGKTSNDTFKNLSWQKMYFFEKSLLWGCSEYVYGVEFLPIN